MNLTPRENALMAYRHQTPAWIPCFYTDISLFQACPGGERYAGHDHGTDWFGVDWKFVPAAGAPMPTNHNGIFDDITEWRDYVKFPDLDAIDWEKQAEIDTHTDFVAFAAGAGLVPLKDGASAYDGDKLMVCMVINGMFERLHAFMGMENALVALMTEPEACKEFFHAMADYKIAYFKKIVQYYKVDVINAHDDYGTNDSLFMAPEVWRELIKPELKRIVDACHEMGVLYQHHSCGYVEPLFEDFIEIGIDAIDTLQASCNPNLKELKQKYGDKITFCGGFDNLQILDRPDVTREEVHAEYERAINDLAPGGSYVIYPIGLGFSFIPHFIEKHFQYGMGFYQMQQGGAGVPEAPAE